MAGMVIVANVAERSGLLRSAAALVTGRVRRPGALLAVALVLGVALTTFANLDSTAVLFTPLALEIAAAAALPLAPFALAAVLAANFGSMLLPTSNLTNLVVWRHSGDSFADFALSHVGIAAVAAILTAGALLVASRPVLRGRQPARPAGGADAGDPPRPVGGGAGDPRLARVTAAAVAVLMVAFVVGVPVGPASLGVAAVLVALRPGLWARRLDAKLIVAVLAVFCAAGLVASSIDPAHRLAGVSPLGLATLAAAISSAGTNLAATLVLEPAAGSGSLRTALVIGANLGVGFTPIASLATVLWRDALRTRGLPVPWRAYFAIAVPLSLVCLALTLVVT